MFRCAKGVVSVLVLSAGAALAQTPIAAIPFESIPPGTSAAGGGEITLEGPGRVEGALAVEGGLVLGPTATVTFDPPLERSLLLGGGDFSPGYIGASSWQVSDEGLLFPLQASSLNMGAQAPIHLPAGAEVHDFVCFIRDNDATADISSGYTRIRSRPINSVQWVNEATAIFPTGPHQGEEFMEVPSDLVGSFLIDPARVYFVPMTIIYTTSRMNSETIAFAGCRIDYTITTWVP